jgi:hypothetical protein
LRPSKFARRSPRVWTRAGGPDRDFGDNQREATHALLTDPELRDRFDERFPERPDAGYDEMVRLLGYVWDCRYDASANVTGYRCAVCGRTRARGRRGVIGRRL